MKKSLAEFAAFEIQHPQTVLGGGSKSCCCDDPKEKKKKGNNGFGNGGDDPAPGNSGQNGSPNADQKLEDIVR